MVSCCFLDHIAPPELTMRLASVVLPLTSSIATVAAGSTKSVSAGCHALTKPLGDAVFFRNSPVYKYESKKFWSNTELMSPGCVFRPQSSHQLAEGLEALVGANAEFAVRGGGHMGIRVRFHNTKACNGLRS
jgi:hypothetical protein